MYAGDCWFYDCGFEGFIDKTVNPNDGQDWVNGETFIYTGSGYRGVGFYGVADNCYADKAVETFFLRGHIANCKTLRYRDDVVTIHQCRSGTLVGHYSDRAPSGNRIRAEHPDFIQGFSNSAPTVRHIEMAENLLSAEGYPMQALFFQHNAWNTRDRTLEEMWQHVYLGNNAVLSGTWNTLHIDRWHGAIVENNVLLLHPKGDFAGGRRAWIRHVDTSSVTLRNNIYAELRNTDAHVDYAHLFTIQSNTDLPHLTHPTPAEYLAIFPNWDNDPLEPLDRFRMDADWVAANPGVGPSILLPTDGLASTR